MTSVPRETEERLNRFKALVVAENQRQNLVSPGSIADFEVRHLDDGAQLVGLGQSGTWCDIGSGAGLPGIVIAILTDEPMTLIEPRRLRADFLRRAVTELGLNAEVVEAKVERVTATFDNITARAVADIDRLFGMAEHVARPGTRWILPKGRSVKKELEAAALTWQGNFSLVPSRTSDEAMILVAEGVRRRGKR